MWQQNSLECFSAAWCIAKVINWDKARITSSKEARWKELSHFWAAAAKLPYLPTTKIKYISNMYQSMYLEDSSCTFLDSLLPFFLKRTKIKGQIRKRKKKGTQESPGTYKYDTSNIISCYSSRARFGPPFRRNHTASWRSEREHQDDLGFVNACFCVWQLVNQIQAFWTEANKSQNERTNKQTGTTKTTE